MNHRERVENLTNVTSKLESFVNPGKVKEELAYCFSGVRHRGDVNLVQAEVWNCGNQSLTYKGKRFKQRSCKIESTNGQNWDRITRSSEEVFVMNMERRSYVIKSFKSINSNLRMN